MWLHLSIHFATSLCHDFFAERQKFKACCNGDKEDNTRDVASAADLRNVRREVVYDEVKEMTTHDQCCEVNIAYNVLNKKPTK